MPIGAGRAFCPPRKHPPAPELDIANLLLEAPGQMPAILIRGTARQRAAVRIAAAHPAELVAQLQIN
jgi:hypothetical protein